MEKKENAVTVARFPGGREGYAVGIPYTILSVFQSNATPEEPLMLRRFSSVLSSGSRSVLQNLQVVLRACVRIGSCGKPCARCGGHAGVFRGRGRARSARPRHFWGRRAVAQVSRSWPHKRHMRSASGLRGCGIGEVFTSFGEVFGILHAQGHKIARAADTQQKRPEKS